MADVRVSLKEANGYLPDVCASCGDEATGTKTRSMSWCPQWVGFLILAGLLPYLIVMIIMTKRATVQIPFCDRHKGHWLYRNLLMGGTLVLFGLIAVLAFVAAAVLGGPRNDDFVGFVCIAAFGLFIVWVIIAIIAQNTAIRPKEITDSEIILTGVGSAFAEAVEEAEQERRSRRKKRPAKWDEDEEEYEEEEEPRSKKKPPPLDGIQEKGRRRTTDDDEDEPRPRKKRPRSDDFEE